jgi:ATP-dependent RNA helicase DDX49/DBP8
MAEFGDDSVQLFAQPRKKQNKRKHNSVDGDIAAPKSKHIKQELVSSSPQLQQDRPEQQLHADAPQQPSNPASTSGASHDSFRDLGVSDWLCAVLDTLGIKQPTQVQVGCIPAILQGRNVIGTAQTGSGKTAAFALPILQHLSKDPFGVFCLVLTPTR